MEKIINKASFENILYLLLMLFPLFALGVRHWTSITFSLLTLLGIIYYLARFRKEQFNLHRYEKIYLWFMVFYFLAFLLSFSINPFDDFGNTRFGNEIRFILVIPLFLLLTRSHRSLQWLVVGSMVAIVIGFGFCIDQIYIKGSKIFTGAYSQLFTGPVLLLYLVIALSYWIPKLGKNDLKGWSLLMLLTILASFSIIQTEVRASYIAYAILSVLFIIFYIKGRLKMVWLIVLIGCLTVLSIYSSPINSRMTLAYNDTINYLTTENHADPNNKDVTTSVGIRLEMWRAAPLVFKDHPLIGVGNGNYNKTVRQFAKQGLIHPVVTNHSHPHNVFVGAVIDKGLIGLISVLLVFFFPLYVYIKTYPVSKYSALSGILYVVSMFAYSMNETATFEKSNFLATYLIFGMVLFTNHMYAIRRYTSN